MKLSRSLTAAATLALAIALSGCSSPAGEQVLDVSWADAYPSLGAMAEHADAVALVNIADIAGTGTVDSDVDETPYTDFQVTVNDAIEGSTNPEIIIRQTGGELDGQKYVVSDDPMLEVGQDYVVFITEFADGQYRIDGGPTGRLAVSGEDLSELPASILDPAEVPATLTELKETLQDK